MNKRDKELRRDLAALPTDIEPARDLWPGIAADLREEAGQRGTRQPNGSADVTPIGSGRRSSALRHRRVPIQWAAAASIALASVVGGAIWMSMRGVTVESNVAAGTPAPTEGVLPGVEASEAGPPGDPAFVSADLSQYESAAAELREVIETGRELLGPETMDVLENSLLAIDQAITEAQQALEGDPGHQGLQRMLQQNHRRKLGLLRQAAAAVQSRT